MTSSNHSHHHHRKSSSITSLSAAAARNPEKIQRLQAFDKWKSDQTDLCPNLLISNVFLRSSHRKKGNFVIECISPDGHWMIEKSLKQFSDFQKNLVLAFPVEAGVTGKPNILPKILFVKCPKWLLLKKEIHCWYKIQIERFMRSLLTCSVFVSKSRILEEFIKSDLLNEEEEEVEMNGKKICISAPLMKTQTTLCCQLEELPLKDEKSETLMKIYYNNQLYPVINANSLKDLEETFDFLKGEKHFYIFNSDNNERILLDEKNFDLNNNLLFMEIA